jgi:serine/threonine-protein kinase
MAADPHAADLHAGIAKDAPDAPDARIAMPANGVPDPVDASSRLVGSVVSGRYRVDKLLGEGGMGAVYLAEHTHMRKRLALKVLHPEMSALPEVVARFEREAVAAAHIDHPHVAQATDFGRTDDGALFLVLEYIEGTSLRNALAQGAFPPARALSIVRQIASALVRAHELGIVHRDLKPENVMLVARGDGVDFVKVLDFGIAKVPVDALSGGAGGQVLTRMGSVFGTPEYMAPEQALGETVDGRADLYSLGTMFYEMLSGSIPFASAEGAEMISVLAQQITAPPPPLASRGAHVPPELEAIVMRLLAKQPADRPHDARELVDALDATAIALGLFVPPPSGSVSYAQLPSRGSLASLPRASMPSVGTSGDMPRPMTTQPSDPSGPAPVLAAVATSPSGSSWSQGDSFAKTYLPGAGPAFESAAGRPGAVIASAGARGSEAAASLRARMPAALRALPLPVLAIAAGIVAVVPLVVFAAVILVVFRPSDPPPVPNTPEGRAAAEAIARAALPDDRIAAAESEGAGALGALAGEYPRDPRVQRALVRRHTKDRALVQAMAAVVTLVGLDPLAASDPEVMGAVRAAAAGPQEASDAAFAAMEGDLRTVGVDLLLELAYAPKTPAAEKGAVKIGDKAAEKTADKTADKAGEKGDRALKARALQSLAKPEVRANATPAALVVLDLRAAKDCAARRAVLARAATHGDARALPLLKPLSAPRGCGFLGRSDCNPCLRKDSALKDAIAAIEGRTRAGAPPPAN